jgi:hypothetical protein
MTHHDEHRAPTPGDEAALRALFDRTAAPVSDDAARRLEAVARGIPADTARRRGPLLGWLTAGAALAATAVLGLLLWHGETPTPSAPDAPALALSPEDVRRDLGADTGLPTGALAEEQFEGWEQEGFDPFPEDEAPSLLSSVSLASGLGDPAEVELWVQAADEILAETDGI